MDVHEQYFAAPESSKLSSWSFDFSGQLATTTVKRFQLKHTICCEVSRARGCSLLITLAPNPII